MLWITLIVALLISATALLFVVWPLLQTDDAPIWVDDDRLSDLLSRKDSTLRAIKELEFDYQVGKVSEADYERFDQRLRRQAIGYMRQIERLTPYTAALEDELEAEIAHQRRTVDGGEDVRPAVDPEPTGTPVSPATTVIPARVEQGEPCFCTECGRPVTPGQRFCGHCGTHLLVKEGEDVMEADSKELPVAQEG